MDDSAQVAYALDWSFYFLRIGIESELTVTVSAKAPSGQGGGLELHIGTLSCAALRSGQGLIKTVAAIDDPLEDGLEHYKSTLAPDPQLQEGTNDCADMDGALRTVIIGVYGAIPSAVGPEGQDYEMNVQVNERTLTVGAEREVAITSSSLYFLLPVTQVA